jgi:hypothetical protein
LGCEDHVNARHARQDPRPFRVPSCSCWWNVEDLQEHQAFLPYSRAKHSVDNVNIRSQDPIGLEEVWQQTKWWCVESSLTMLTA